MTALCSNPEIEVFQAIIFSVAILVMNEFPTVQRTSLDVSIFVASSSAFPVAVFRASSNASMAKTCESLCSGFSCSDVSRSAAAVGTAATYKHPSAILANLIIPVDGASAR